MTTTSPGADWYPDPSGRHMQRYWDGTAWTNAVAGAEGGAPQHDPIPVGTLPVPSALSRPRPAGEADEVAAVSLPVSGWFADPSGRHPLRYREGGEWSDIVATADGASRDFDSVGAAGLRVPATSATASSPAAVSVPELVGKPRSRRPLRQAAVAGVLCLAVAFGAIAVLNSGGGGEQSVKPAVLIQSAPAKTTAQASRVATSVSLNVDGKTETVQSTEGVQDPSTHVVDLTLTSPLSKFDASRQDLVVHILSTELGVVYEQISGLTFPGAKSWVRITRADVGISDAAAASGGSGDPADGLQFLQGVHDPIEIGTETVRGVATTHYGVTVDLTRLLDLIAQSSAKLSPGFASKLGHLKGKLALDQLPGGVWLDERGRVRRFELSMTVKSGSRQVTTNERDEFYDFGTEVVVTPPPANQVADFPAVVDELRNYISSLTASASTS